MDGFSPDGFITDQDCFEDYRRRMEMENLINNICELIHAKERICA